MFGDLFPSFDIWFVLKATPELSLGLCIKLFIEEGEISWAAFKDAYLTGWGKPRETFHAEPVLVAPGQRTSEQRVA